MKTTKERILHCYLIDGKVFSKQKDLVSYLKVGAKALNSKVFRAAQKQEEYFEINNKFVKLLTKKQAAELLINTKQQN